MANQPVFEHARFVSVKFAVFASAIAVAVALFSIAYAVIGNNARVNDIDRIAKANASLLSDVQTARFKNTAASCEDKNAENGRVVRVFLANIPADRREKAAPILREAWPQRGDCQAYAASKVCVDAAKQSAPCQAYAARRG